MVAIPRILFRRAWISVFLIELFGAGLVLTMAALLLDYHLMKMFFLGGAFVFFATGFTLLAPPVYNKLHTKETLFKMLSTLPLWLALAVFSVELFLHLAVFHSPLQYVYGEYAGKQPVAGSILLWGKEGYGITHYGEDGEVAGSSSVASSDVIVLGDSFTQAMQVMDNEKYTTVAEKILQKEGLSIRVHNYGASGLCLSDYTYFADNLNTLLPQLKPEILVVQISLNDINDNPFVDTRSNYFSKEPDGAFTAKHNPNIDNSAESGIRQIVRMSSIAKLMKDRFWPGDAARTSIDVSFDRQIEAFRKASSGKRVIILLLPDDPSIKNGSLVFEDEEYDRLVKTFRAIPEWNVIDPLPEFKKLALNGHLPRGFSNSLPGVGHMNVLGHQVVGQLLAQKILELERGQ